MKAAPARLAGFAAVGAVGFAVDAGLLTLGLALGWPEALARAVSLTTALHLTFLGNGRFVFGNLSRERLGRQWVGYMIANGLGAGANYAVFLALVAGHLPGLSSRPVAFVAAAVAGAVVNYIGIGRLAFRERAA
ncbi:MAG: GtrA family protein [Caulobacter sp.]|nr:GtrA family protein [Caulobacter sp.]